MEIIKKEGEGLMPSFTDQQPRKATREDLTARWLGGNPGEYFRCCLCGYKFKLGDYWRWVYTNHVPYAGGNPIVCEKCDGTNEEVAEKWKKMRKEVRTKYWYFFVRR